MHNVISHGCVDVMKQLLLVWDKLGNLWAISAESLTGLKSPAVITGAQNLSPVIWILGLWERKSGEK